MDIANGQNQKITSRDNIKGQCQGVLENDQGMLGKDQGHSEKGKDKGWIKAKLSWTTSRDNTNGPHQGTTPRDHIKGQHQGTALMDNTSRFWEKIKGCWERSRDARNDQGTYRREGWKKSRENTNGQHQEQHQGTALMDNVKNSIKGQHLRDEEF